MDPVPGNEESTQSGTSTDSGVEPPLKDRQNTGEETLLSDAQRDRYSESFVDSQVSKPTSTQNRDGNWVAFTPPKDRSPRVEPAHIFGANAGVSGGLVGTSFGPLTGRPDSAVDYAEIGRWSVRAASVRGRSHRHYNTPRQDDYALLSADDVKGRPHLCIAVCDGISSGKLSHIAAQQVSVTAVEALAHSVSTIAGPIDWLSVLRDTNSRTLSALCDKTGQTANGSYPSVAEIRSRMVTTLVLVLVPIDPPFLVEGISIGDSSCWRIEGSGMSSLTGVKNQGAEVASSTVGHALPDSPQKIDDRFLTRFSQSFEPGDALAVVSDGVGDAFGAGRAPVAREMASMWPSPPPPYEFASQIDFACAGFDDDRTAVGLWLS